MQISAPAAETQTVPGGAKILLDNAKLALQMLNFPCWSILTAADMIGATSPIRQ
jgi:hypothetical protein